MASNPADVPADALPQGKGEDTDAANVWVAELEHRAADVRSSTARTEDWATVKARLAERWRRG